MVYLEFPGVYLGKSAAEIDPLYIARETPIVKGAYEAKLCSPGAQQVEVILVVEAEGFIEGDGELYPFLLPLGEKLWSDLGQGLG